MHTVKSTLAKEKPPVEPEAKNGKLLIFEIILCIIYYDKV